MGEIQTIDARGLSCPQPAMLARQSMQKQNKGTVEVLVDSGTARENVIRLAKNYGWSVTIENKTDGSVRIILKK